MKKCPFLNENCLEDECQLWVKIAEERKACSLAAFPSMIGLELARIVNAIYETGK